MIRLRLGPIRLRLGPLSSPARTWTTLVFLSAIGLLAGCDGDDVVAPISTPPTVQGVVTASTTGDPIAGAEVSIGAASVTTGLDGRFELTNLATGPATLRCITAGFEDFETDITVSSGKMTRNISLSPAEGPEPPSAGPAAIVIVSGNDQETKANLRLDEPLVVRVTDEQGHGVASIPVEWKVTSGSGSWSCSGDDCLLSDGNGLAQVSFYPRSVGTTTVTASVAGLQASPATFTVEVRGLVIWIGASRNWGFAIYPDHVTVPVGTTIEWWSEPSYSITSTSVPPGGESFASGVLGSSKRFEFVPVVAGTWEYRVREYDAEMPNGGAEGVATITVE